MVEYIRSLLIVNCENIFEITSGLLSGNSASPITI